MDIPASIKNTVVKQTVSNAVALCPHAQRIRLAVVGYESNIALVPPLYKFGCPPNIALFVMSIIINPVNGMLGRRPTSQFTQKLFITLKTKLNAPAAIVSIGRIVGVIATVSRVAVRAIFRRVMRRLPVNKVATSIYSGIKTPARPCVPYSEIASRNDNPIAACTHTKPEHLSSGRCTPKADNGQSPETLSRQIAKFVMSGLKRCEGAKVQFRHFSLLFRLKCSGSFNCLRGWAGRSYFTMKNLTIISVITFAFLVFAGSASAQSECPADKVCISREAAIKALADADKVTALEKESEAKDKAIADIRKELNDMRIEFARVSGENTGLKTSAVRMDAILDLALKNTKKKCMPLSVCF
jgi:hypothetical protein